MRTLGFIVGLLIAAVGAVAGSPAPSHAATVDECQVLLVELRQDTVDSARSFTNAESADRLVLKLDGAATNLGHGKYAEPGDKVARFPDHADPAGHGTQPRVDPTTAAALSTRAQGIIDCIAALG